MNAIVCVLRTLASPHRYLKDILEICDARYDRYYSKVKRLPSHKKRTQKLCLKKSF